jgi:hypothetical protein
MHISQAIHIYNAPLTFRTSIFMMPFSYHYHETEHIVTMIIATIATAAILPSLVTGYLNLVRTQGQNATAGNMTETEGLPS